MPHLAVSCLPAEHCSKKEAGHYGTLLLYYAEDRIPTRRDVRTLLTLTHTLRVTNPAVRHSIVPRNRKE